MKHWCFCGKELHLRKIGKVSGENLSSAFEALPEHAQEDGARCPYSGQPPRFDPRPHEMVKFGPVELDRKAAAENLSRLLSRTARLFARPASLAPAE